MGIAGVGMIFGDRVAMVPSDRDDLPHTRPQASDADRYQFHWNHAVLAATLW